MTLAPTGLWTLWRLTLFNALSQRYEGGSILDTTDLGSTNEPRSLARRDSPAHSWIALRLRARATASKQSR